MPKLFTVDEANRTLPLVRRIVDDIVRGYAAWQDKVHECELAAAGAPGADAERLQQEAQRLAADIEQCQRELGGLGVEFKGYDMGLVDFPAAIDGRPVYLCWRLGEARVEHWHERDAGFAGRQPLAPVMPLVH
ncbi:MAG: DUF2203 domain-containing protein [Gemmatimonadetes bacterium]|nr:DUF2203 domain-containing protein [Gemmatimonadota bacterium]